MKYLNTAIILIFFATNLFSQAIHSKDDAKKFDDEVRKYTNKESFLLISWELNNLNGEKIVLNKGTTYEVVILTSNSKVSLSLARDNRIIKTNKKYNKHQLGFSFTCTQSGYYNIIVKDDLNSNLQGSAGLYYLGRNKTPIENYPLLPSSKSGSLQSQSKGEVTLTVKLISAECVDFCYYIFKDISTGEEINLDWNLEWDKQKDARIFPGLDDESAKIINFIEKCAQDFYGYGTNTSNCKEVLDKTFAVKAVKKTREEKVGNEYGTMEKTGEIEVYYEIKNISKK